MWGIGREQLGFRAIEQAGHGAWVGGVAAQEPMVAQDEEIAGLGAWRAGRLFESLPQIEALHLLALLASFKGAQQVGDLILAEAGQREVD